MHPRSFAWLVCALAACGDSGGSTTRDTTIASETTVADTSVVETIEDTDVETIEDTSVETIEETVADTSVEAEALTPITVSIEPLEPTTTDDLHALLGGTSTATYTWTADDADAGITDGTVPAAATTKHQVWTVTATAPDGAQASASVTIRNSPPEKPRVSISRTPSRDLFCASTIPIDPDDDVLTRRAAWTIDGAPFADTTDAEIPGDTVPLALVVPGVWRCVVTADDGDGGTAASLAESFSFARVPCDGGVLDNADASNYAKAIGLCNGEVLEAQLVGFDGPNGPSQRAIATQFGTNNVGLNRPIEGQKMIILSTGRADTGKHDLGTAADGDATDGACDTPVPIPWRRDMIDPCGPADPVEVCDVAGLYFKLKVPPDAHHLSFSWQFFSAEYPTFRCGAQADAFVAVIGSEIARASVNLPMDACLGDNGDQDLDDDGSISAGEGAMRPAAVPPNTCSDPSGARLAGTGYVQKNAPGPSGDPVGYGAGATLVRTATKDVEPGSTIELFLHIWDAGDDAIDSTVVIDAFTWSP